MTLLTQLDYGICKSCSRGGTSISTCLSKYFTLRLLC